MRDLLLWLVESCSLTRDGNQAPCIRSSESSPLDHQETPYAGIFVFLIRHEYSSVLSLKISSVCPPLRCAKVMKTVSSVTSAFCLCDFPKARFCFHDVVSHTPCLPSLLPSCTRQMRRRGGLLTEGSSISGI